MVNALSAYTQGSLKQINSYPADETAGKNANPQDQSTNESNAAPMDTVGISAEARELVQAEKTQNAALDAKVSYFEQFRPTREGFSSRNLALGIVDPSAQPFSQNRSFEEVALAARENLDSKYQLMREKGEPYGTDNFEGKESYSLMGDLDRRALYAVASNEGDAFSKKEQKIARSIMSGQQGMAMGFYNGPIALQGKFAAIAPSSNSDNIHAYKAGIQYMDQVSLEEKATDVKWAHQRATLQWVYEKNTQESGFPAENFDIDHPLVNLILEALESAPGHNKSDMDVSNRKDLPDEPWFKGYEDRLDTALAQTRELYGLTES